MSVCNVCLAAPTKLPIQLGLKGPTYLAIPRPVLQTHEELRAKNICDREEKFKQMGFGKLIKNLVKDLEVILLHDFCSVPHQSP